MTPTPVGQVSVLSNGLRVVTTEIPWARQAAITLAVRVGSRDESKAHKGISHFAEHLCFRGSAEYSTETELMAQFRAIGAYTNGSTDFDCTQFHVGVRPQHLTRALHLLAGMVHRHPLNGFAVERRVVLDELRHYSGPGLNDTEDSSVGALWTEYGGPTIGTTESVENLKLEDLRAHFSRFYVGKNMVLSIASALPTVEMLAATAPFSELLAGLPNLRTRPPPPRPGAMHHRQREEHECQLRMSFPLFGAPDTAEPTLAVLNHLLQGTGFGALFTALRSTRGLVYSCHSNCFFHSDFAFETVSLDPNPADPLTPLTVVLGVLAGMKRLPPSRADLDAAKQSALMLLASQIDDPWALSNNFAQCALNAWPLDPRTHEARLANVTAEQVHALAQQLFKTGAGHLSYAGPEKHQKALWKVFKAL